MDKSYITTALLNLKRNTNEIPSAFKKVEYLESISQGSIGQAIDTKEKARGSLGIEIKAQSIEASSEVCFWFGGENAWANGTSFNCQAGPSGYGFIYANQKGCGNTSKTLSRLDKPYVFKAINGTISVDDFVSTYGKHNFNSNTNVTLFSINRNNKIVRYDRCRIWYCKLYENDKLIHNFVPCLDNNNVPCMFDTITQNASYNIGSGQFTYGNIIQ